MKKLGIQIFSTLIAVLALFSLYACTSPALDIRSLQTSVASVASGGNAKEGVSIQDGILTYSAGHYLAGQPLSVGYDRFGYNYQAHQFKGSYANVYLGRDGFPPYDGDDESYLAGNPGAAAKWYWPYRETWLLMKWNDAWLSNRDRDGDGLLDRHYGFDSYVGSGAWETNHMKGEEAGTKWTYFTKIVAVPEDATTLNGIWYGADGIEIGPSIWGEFATIQTVDSGLGATYISPSGPGFGQY